MIRPRRDEDLECCIALLRQVHDREGYPANWPTNPERWLSSRNSIGTWVLAKEGRGVLGHVALLSVDAERAWPDWLRELGRPARELGVVSRLFVDPQARREGIGGQLLAHAEQQAHARNLHPVLDVARHNHAAIALYRHRGWRRTGTTTLAPGDEGHALDLVLLIAPHRLDAVTTPVLPGAQSS